MVLPKCCVFPKMSIYVFTRTLINKTSSLLCDFDAKNIYLCFWSREQFAELSVRYLSILENSVDAERGFSQYTC